jgi:alpha-acetolactate decarboxylase
MSTNAKEFELNFKRLNDLSLKLQNTNVQDVSQIVQNLPSYIEEFKEADVGVNSMLKELEAMEALIQEKIN